MQILIILSVFTSFLHDILKKFLPLGGVVSSVTMVITLLILLLFLVKYKRVYVSKTLLTLIVMNVLIIFLQIVFIGINFASVKLFINYLFILVIASVLEEHSLSKIFNIIVFISSIFSLEIIFQGSKAVAQGIDLVNLRHYLILEKQSYNGMFLYSLSILIIILYNKRKLTYLLLFILNLIPSLFFLQIKTLLLAIPVAGLILFIKNKGKGVKIFVFSALIISLLTFYFSFNIFEKYLPTQIRVTMTYFLHGEDKIDKNMLKYADTVMIRQVIIENALIHFKKSPILGIGYGNYSSIVQGISVKSIGKNVVYELPKVTENGVLTFMVEGGLLGLIGHFVVIIFIFRSIRFNNLNKQDKIALLIMFSFVFSNFVQDNLSYLYWFSIAIGVRAAIRNKKENSV